MCWFFKMIPVPVTYVYDTRKWSIANHNGRHNFVRVSVRIKALLWRHNGRGSISNHQPHDCLLNRLFRRRSKKTSKLRVTGLCAGSIPVTGEFPAHMASNAKNVSIWWRHHGFWQINGFNKTYRPNTVRVFGRFCSGLAPIDFIPFFHRYLLWP